MIIVPRAQGAGPASEADPLAGPRVVVVGGQPLFLRALAGLLARPPLNATADLTSSSTEALAMIAESSPHVVLCDLRVRPGPFRSFLGSVRALADAPPVIVLADVEEVTALVGEIDSGAAGLFTKDAEPEQFMEGVRAVLAGHRAIGANVLGRLVSGLNGAEGTGGRPGMAHLSPTEIDILTMVGAARSVEQIAEARRISQKTVRNHLASIYRKLDLRSRTEAMLCAARMGLTPS